MRTLIKYVEGVTEKGEDIVNIDIYPLPDDMLEKRVKEEKEKINYINNVLEELDGRWCGHRHVEYVDKVRKGERITKIDFEVDIYAKRPEDSDSSSSDNNEKE